MTSTPPSHFWDDWEHNYAPVGNDITLHYIDVGPRDATPVVLVHGWPDLWFGWRYQIQALSKTHRVIVPDLRGFGRSSAPKTVEGYGTKKVTGDLAGLLDFLNIPRAVFCGHDWGGALTWRMCIYHPERVIAACAICTPYFPQGKACVDYDMLIPAIPQFSYMKLLGDSERAAKLLDKDPRRIFTAMYRKYDEFGDEFEFLKMVENVNDSTDPVYTQPSDLLSEAELDYYVAEYSRSGFFGSCCYYSTRQQDFKDEKDLPRVIQHESLYIGAVDDPILKPELAAGMPRVMPNLKQELVRGGGHWLLWEKKDEVIDILQRWLKQLDLSETSSTAAAL
ncbi:Bifunctional epoxide hydrolase 2 [Phytophthora ramorum]|uniref:AB hydrolase-1 domain-containing protein n=1 Tax=Phytophthora ramorum TaxID=164328 RepID=H3GNJ6_PHYRM|nr:Bifunctional epoxide hydrolase 2 [Phytophthora ramorum]